MYATFPLLVMTKRLFRLTMSKNINHLANTNQCVRSSQQCITSELCCTTLYEWTYVLHWQEINTHIIKARYLRNFGRHHTLDGAAPYSTIYDMVDSLTWNTDAGKQINTWKREFKRKLWSIHNIEGGGRERYNSIQSINDRLISYRKYKLKIKSSKD